MMVAVDTVTIPGVELLKAGKWHGTLDGEPAIVEVTTAQLAAAVAASTDPEVDHAPLKVGHTSKLLGDGAPALGWLRNFRTTNGGKTLVADLADVPRKFAKLLPKAFRRRSPELAYGLKTPGGKTYALAVTALSALGVSPPAVKGLADIEDLFAASEGGVDADHQAVAMLADGLDLEAVSRVTSAIDALDALDLEPETRAKLAADIEDAAGVGDATIPPPASDPGQDGADAAGSESEETPTVTITDEKLREMIGAEADADLEAEIKALKAKADKAPAEGEGGDEGAPSGKGGATETAEGDESRELATAGLSATTLAELKAAGVNVVSDELLTELRAPGAQLAEARRAAVLDKAVHEGRISPAERGEAAEGDKPATGFAALMASDEAATTALLESMTPRFAVAELGAATAPDAAADAAFDEFEASFLPTAAAGE